MDKKHRSPSYPPMSLREAIERVGTLYKAVGSHSTSREVLARGLGYSGISGASATTIGALNKYGLIEGRGDEVRVSDRAMAILHPHSQQEKDDALRAAATEPDLFREIAERFPGGDVNDDVLTNYLLRNKFSPHAVQAAVSAYRETVEFVVGIRPSYDSPTSTAEAGSKAMTPQSTQQQPQLPIITLKQDVDERRLGRWDFEDGGYVEIRATPGVSTEDALDMIETLVELRRKELARKKKDGVAGSEGSSQ